MSKMRAILVGSVLLLVSASVSQAVLYEGELSSADGGLLGQAGWVDPGVTTISWSINDNPDGSWHYEYELATPGPGHEVSHFILEASDTFTVADIIAVNGPFLTSDIKIHEGMAPGNPEMPDDIYGIKFDGASGTTITIILDAWRMPTWGDFYAKNGGNPPNVIYNAGLTTNDSDPLAPPTNGAFQNHILVPDSYVPEPGTIALLGLGAIALFRRRKT